MSKKVNNNKVIPAVETVETVAPATTPADNQPAPAPAEQTNTLDKMTELSPYEVAKAYIDSEGVDITSKEYSENYYIVRLTEEQLASDEEINPQEIIDEINTNNFNFAFATAVNFGYNGKNVVDYHRIAKGIKYIQLDSDGKGTEKTIKVNDIVCKKATEKSNKIEIDGKLFNLLDCMGANCHDSFHASADSIGILKKYDKFIPALACFTDYTNEQGQKIKASSTASLVKQFYEMSLNLGFTVEYIEDKTADGYKDNDRYLRQAVKHLKDKYIKATATGYRNGDEIRFLTCLIEELYRVEQKKELDNKSALAIHKIPKDKK